MALRTREWNDCMSTVITNPPALVRNGNFTTYSLHLEWQNIQFVSQTACAVFFISKFFFVCVCDTFACSHYTNTSFLFHHGARNIAVFPQKCNNFISKDQLSAPEWEFCYMTACQKTVCIRKKNYPYPICCCNYGYGQHFDWQFFLNFAARWRKDTRWRSPLSFMWR